jgi:kinesin family member 4
VKVAVRVRPFVPREIDRGCVSILEKTPGEAQLEVTGDSNSKTENLFTFNNVFMPGDTQEMVYNDCVQPIIGKLFEGYNVTILAYGQTGSGKTYSMGTVFDGDMENSNMGIIPRALRDIFESIKKNQGDSIITVTCSFMELYQEVLFDLLANRPRHENVCDIREDGVKGIYISGLSEVPVADELEATKCLVKGGNCRSIGATAMNDVSSRSHAIFTVNITKTQLNGDGKTSAKFHLVDLAGSERSKKTQATGTRFKEGVKINQGLLALGNVISALGGGATGVNYISYRDSKLTRLLQDSLGGNSVTLMVACVSPADYNIEETLSTLRYADRAKKIKNKPVKNEDSHAAEVARLKKTIQDLRMQLMNTDPAKAFGKRTTLGTTSNECSEKCKTNVEQKNKELLEARQQLNTLILTIHDLNNLHVLEESFINDFITVYESFRDKVLKTCSAEFAMPDTNIFAEIREKADEIQTMIKKFKQQVQDADDSRDISTVPGGLSDVDQQKYTEFTQNQIAFITQINALERDMKIKQQLLDRKYQNVPIIDEDSDKTMIEYENTIKNLEKELEELRSSNANSAARRDFNATKVNMDRKHKIEKLEKDLVEVRKKCTSLEKTKKLADQDRKRIEDLRREIEEMKKARVQLLRQQSEYYLKCSSIFKLIL